MVTLPMTLSELNHQIAHMFTFWILLHIFWMDEVFKINFVQIGHIKYHPEDENLPPNGRDQGHVTVF